MPAFSLSSGSVSDVESCNHYQVAAVGGLLLAFRSLAPLAAQSEMQDCSSGTLTKCEEVTTTTCVETKTTWVAGQWYVGYREECVRWETTTTTYYYKYDGTGGTGGGGGGGTGAGDGGGGDGGGGDSPCGDPDLWTDDGAGCDQDSQQAS
jgi:uncharacterized membrane protein YgcG